MVQEFFLTKDLSEWEISRQYKFIGCNSTNLLGAYLVFLCGVRCSSNRSKVRGTVVIGVQQRGVII